MKHKITEKPNNHRAFWHIAGTKTAPDIGRISDARRNDFDTESATSASLEVVGLTHIRRPRPEARHVFGHVPAPCFAADFTLQPYKVNMTAIVIAPIFGAKSTTYPRHERIGFDDFTRTTKTRGTFMIEGVVVKLEQRTEAWHYEFPEFGEARSARGTHRKTTKLRDLAAAIRFAKDAFFIEQQHHRNGTSSKVPTVAEVIPAFLSHLKTKIVPDNVRPSRSETSNAAYAEMKKFYERPLSEIHGDLRLTMLDAAAVEAFHVAYADRNAKAGRAPAKTPENKNRHEGYILRLIGYALEHRLISVDPLPRFQKAGRSKTHNGIADQALWLKMAARLPTWADEPIRTSMGGTRVRNTEEKLCRTTLRSFIILLRLTGLRVAEANCNQTQLQWS